MTSSLAAIIVILALAIDRFTQQVLKHYSCDQPDRDSFGTIPRASSFELASQHIQQRASSQTMDPGMLTTIANGFLDTAGKSSIVAAVCATGNCTFYDFQSISLCTKYRDSTSLVQSYCNNTSIVHEFTALKISGDLHGNFIETGGQDALVTSNDISSWTFDGIDVFGGINVLALTNNNTRKAMQWLIPANASSEYCRSQGVFAAECGVYPCVSSYEAVFKYGNFSKRLIATKPLPVKWDTPTNTSESWQPIWPGPSCFGMIKPSCLTEVQRRNISNHGIPISNTAGWIHFAMLLGTAFHQIAILRCLK
jgi:hypothetical protein